jgi:hypothetical protein
MTLMIQVKWPAQPSYCSRRGDGRTSAKSLSENLRVGQTFLSVGRFSDRQRFARRKVRRYFGFCTPFCTLVLVVVLVLARGEDEDEAEDEDDQPSVGGSLH